MTLASRGLDFAVLDPEFFLRSRLTLARHGRFRAIGEFEGDIIVVIFATVGTEAISVISMRRASRKERQAHATQEGPATDG
jgi:uncharacterized DUF497 family protein